MSAIQQYVDVALAPEGCNSELTIEVGDENILDYEYKPNNRIINITGKKAGVTTINVGADDATRKSIKVTVLQPCNDLASLAKCLQRDDRGRDIYTKLG